MNIPVVFLFLVLTLSVAAEEVRLLRLPISIAPLAVQRMFPAGNYTFDRKGDCYVAGEPEALDAFEFPVDSPAAWEGVELHTRPFPLVGGCHYDGHEQVIESVPILKIIGYLQTSFPEVVFVPGMQGRWHVVGDPDSVARACRLAEHLPDFELPSFPTVLTTDPGLHFYDYAFGKSIPVGVTEIRGVQTFPEPYAEYSSGRLRFRF